MMHTRSALARRLTKALLPAIIATIGFALVSGTPAQAAPGGEEQQFLDATNAARAQNGLAPLAWDETLANVARGWTAGMAAAHSLSHNPSLVDQVNAFVTNQWQRIGENVGYGGTVAGLHNAFMNSPGHRANVLGDYNRVGIGVVRDGAGTIWVTLDFVKAPGLVAQSPAPAAATPTWFLRNQLTTGIADSQFSLGAPFDQVLACDWNGDGIDTPGIFRNGVWFVTDELSAAGIRSFSYGSPGDTPLCGDWNGDGVDTPGIFRDGAFFLRNSNSSGVADISFVYGVAGDRPTVGDWNGDGIDTPGVFRNGKYYLRNSNTTGIADGSFSYGDPGDRPLVGDWNGDGTDTIGIWRNGALYLKNTNSSGIADYVFGYGNPGDAPIIGDWDHNSTDTLGVVRGGI
jgi:uncharacterized protein YkwD